MHDALAPMPRGWVHDGVSDNSPSIIHLANISTGSLETAMSTLPGHDHMSSSKAPPLDGKGGTDSAAKVGKSTKRTSPSYGAPYPDILITRILASIA